MKSSWTRNVVAGGVLLVGGASSGGAYALEGTDITLRPYATSGFQLYDLSAVSQDEDGSQYSYNADSNYLFLGAGVTALMSQFYVDVSFSTSIAAEVEDFEETADLDRNDFSIAAGYLLPNGFAVFGGYTNANTDLDFYVGEEGFEADGLFGGGSYKWSINDRIQFNVHAAIAFLNGTYKYSGRAFGDSFSSDSDTIGFSFGFSASTMLTDSITASGFIKTQSYTYDEFEDLFPGSTFEVEETLTTLGVNIGIVL